MYVIIQLPRGEPSSAVGMANLCGGHSAVTKEAEGTVAVDISQTLWRSGKMVRQDDPRHGPPKKGGELAVSPTPTGAAVTNGILGQFQPRGPPPPDATDIETDGSVGPITR